MTCLEGVDGRVACLKCVDSQGCHKTYSRLYVAKEHFKKTHGPVENVIDNAGVINDAPEAPIQIDEFGYEHQENYVSYNDNFNEGYFDFNN